MPVPFKGNRLKKEKPKDTTQVLSRDISPVIWFTQDEETYISEMNPDDTTHF